MKTRPTFTWRILREDQAGHCLVLETQAGEPIFKTSPYLPKHIPSMTEVLEEVRTTSKYYRDRDCSVEEKQISLEAMMEES